MSNHVNEAFRRAAARGGPLFKTYHAFGQALDDKGRPDPGKLDWLYAAPGALRWRDVDDGQGAGGVPGAGAGVVTLYTEHDMPLPVALQGPDGAWLLVASGLERDSLGAGLRLAVERWTGAAPTIRRGAP